MFSSLNLIEVFVEIFIGKQSQGVKQLVAPEFVLIQQFNQIIDQVGRFSGPAKVIFSQPTFNENGQRIKDNLIIFENFKYRNEFGGEKNGNI